VNIPIQNIYYLLCYAWDKLEERDVVDVDALDSTTLADLFARVLINGTNHLIRQGLDRAYVTEHEWTGRVRGRIDFAEVVRRSGAPTCKLPCDFDEFSHNILHNRILKATFHRLLRLSSLSSENAEGLARLCRMFGEIRDVELSGRIFGQVQLHRNNQFYDFLLKICELTYRNLLVAEEKGESKFADFVRDPRQMAVLFENFIRNFYLRETDYKVERKNLYWRWQPGDEESKALLPLMQTDISLTRNSRRIIIECKYTPEATQKNYESQKLRSTHLYQLNAYMANLPEDEISASCEFILLYPTVDASLAATYYQDGHCIRIHTINLHQPWAEIDRDLRALVAHDDK
jgi:5-methylcytosine-specific restriction enzyme subunit McrC